MMPGLQTVSVVDALAASLREAIMRGELPAGTSVSEAQLAQRYQVARPTARAALQTLTHDGLLVRQPNRSVFIPRMTIDDLRDVFRIRRMVELEAAEHHAASGIVPRGAAQATRQLELLDDEAPWHEAAALDLSVHRELVAGVGSPRLLRTFETIADETRLCIAQLRPSYESFEPLAAEHRELLDAIQSADVDLARATLDAHLAASLEILTGQLSEPGDA
jgi:DNA-binding GntR family transcriptional regulator